MPRGFSGRHAAAYLGKVSEAHANAVSTCSQTPEGAPPGPRQRRLPYGLEDAYTGSFSTGRGDSSNIVASESEYEAICRTISQADDKIGECLHNTAAEINELCQTTFILPHAVPRCLNISESVNSILNEFRSVTDDSMMQTRKYVSEIINIGY